MAVNVPGKLYAGDKLEITIPGYDGRSCVFALNRQGFISKTTAAQDGNNWVATLSSATTQGYKVGKYNYHITLTQDGERETLQTGSIEVLPDLSVNPVDATSHAERVLAAIEATLEGKATQDQEQLSINGRAIKRFAPEQLLKWRDKYRQEVTLQKRREAIKNGGVNTGIIYTRF